MSAYPRSLALVLSLALPLVASSAHAGGEGASKAPMSIDAEGTNYKPGFCEGGGYTLMYLTAKLLVERYPDLQIEIAGHADGLENDPDALSSCRAQRVYEYLRIRGIGANRMIVRGYGAERPLDTNETSAGRQRNRRVEINVRN